MSFHRHPGTQSENTKEEIISSWLPVNYRPIMSTSKSVLTGRQTPAEVEKELQSLSHTMSFI